MLGFTTTVTFQPPIPSPIRSNPQTKSIPYYEAATKSFRLHFRVPGKLQVKAEMGNGEAKAGEEEKKIEDGGGGEPKKKDRGGSTLNLKWRDLLDPDPENILAVGLSGVLTWASVQVLWQLFCISFAILVAALKYSFIAALLIFILITLL